MLRLENFLRRNGQPHHPVDPSQDKAAALLLTQYGAGAQDVLVACPNGSMLLTPSEGSLARCLGMLDTLERDELFDVAVVEQGEPVSPLPSARHRRDCGSLSSSAARSGAKPARARVQNYLGFPTGISGQALAARAFVQAQEFGAQSLIPALA